MTAQSPEIVYVRHISVSTSQGSTQIEFKGDINSF